MASVRVTITLDADLLSAADELARELGASRSRLFARALDEFIRRHRNRRIFDQLNAAYADGPTAD
jgi:metal-responsive CopG/Arc/MetJ family transcriptional regulator